MVVRFLGPFIGGAAVAAVFGAWGMLATVVFALVTLIRGDRLALLVTALALALTGAACAKRADGTAVSAEGTLALRGNQFVQALRTVITPAGASPIEQLVAAKRLTPAEAVEVVTVVRQTFVYAQDLSQLLLVVDNAKTAAERQDGLLKAHALVQRAADGLATASLSVGTVEGRRAVVDTLRVAAQALLLVGSIFPAGVGGFDDAAFALASAGF